MRGSLRSGNFLRKPGWPLLRIVRGAARLRGRTSEALRESPKRAGAKTRAWGCKAGIYAVVRRPASIREQSSAMLTATADGTVGSFGQPNTAWLAAIGPQVWASA